MQTRTLVGLGGAAALAVAAVTQLSMQSQDRQYKKTLSYMHEARDKVQQKMDQLNTPKK
jgi:putative NADH-flavin reductase